MVRIRIAKVGDEFQFLTCLRKNLWGSPTSRFKDWQVGDYVALVVGKHVAGLAQVAGSPFTSQERVWDNGLYPHRVPLKFVHALRPDRRPPILGPIRDALTSAWGPSYGIGILGQQLLVEAPAETVVNAVRAVDNDLSLITQEIDDLLAQAQSQRVKRNARRRAVVPGTEVRANPQAITLPINDEEGTEEEESEHTRAQASLIELGKIAGCEAWIANNDKSRLYKGDHLGQGCLEALPNFGLNPEDTKGISLIDVIWIKQGAPVCAFEVETTTRVYSGLLRMSDLLSLVNAIRFELFIAAPAARQDKVMRELGRPTFRKIGLDDFCQFISTERLFGLLPKIRGLEGHVQPTVVDTISIGLGDVLVGANSL